MLHDLPEEVAFDGSPDPFGIDLDRVHGAPFGRGQRAVPRAGLSTGTEPGPEERLTRGYPYCILSTLYLYTGHAPCFISTEGKGDLT